MNFRTRPLISYNGIIKKLERNMYQAFKAGNYQLADDYQKEIFTVRHLAVTHSKRLVR